MPGIASVPEGSLERCLRGLEYFELASRATERGLIVNAAGDIIFDELGTRSALTFPLKLVVNKIVLHNHPSGVSFSPSDVLNLGIDGDVRELRVVGRPRIVGEVSATTYLYRILRPDGGWPMKAVVRKTLRVYDRAVERELLREMELHCLGRSKAEAEHLHRVWLGVGNELDFHYERLALD